MARKDPGGSAGWIKLHRSITGWRWARDPNVFRLWIQLLLMVDYETGEPIRTTLPEISEATGLSIQMVRTALAKLESTGEIEQVTTTHGRTIRITKWTVYQATDRATDRSTDRNHRENAATTDKSWMGLKQEQQTHQQTEQQTRGKPSIYYKKENKNLP